MFPMSRSDSIASIVRLGLLTYMDGESVKSSEMGEGMRRSGWCCG